MQHQTKNQTSNKIQNLEESKLIASVWNDRVRDICYQNHFKNVRVKNFQNLSLTLRLSFVASKNQEKDRQYSSFGCL